ncbi:MAG: response regulator [Chthoniobacteraceae bacterium]
MRTILLIDDDEFCRAPAAELLRRNQWNVIEATDGEKGIELAVKHRPDVILCDLLMPRGNGYHVCRTVRAQLDLRHTKIIVVTGRDYASDRKSAQEAGADDYLVKPIVFDELLNALDRVLPAGPNGTGRAQEEAVAAGAEATRVKFWGVRGSIPSPGPQTVTFGGNTSCVEVRADGQIIVLDAGSGIRGLGQALDEEFKEAPIDLTLLISHTHWDHIQGFPFFLPAYHAKNRLRILGYEGARDGLAATLAGQMESPYFPIALKQMPGNIVIEELKEMQFKIGPVRVEACFSNHPGVCVGYRLFTSAGSIVYLPDNESVHEPATSTNGTDTLPRTIEQRLATFVKDADVLICDAQYTRGEYDAHIGWGHGCVDDVVRFAIAGNVKQLFLFHHDPAHDDAFIAGMLSQARDLAAKAGSTLRVEAAREADEIVLAPRLVAAK